MFLAIIAFTLNSFRNYFMLNQQNSIDDESDNDDDYEIGIERRKKQMKSVKIFIHLQVIQIFRIKFVQS